MCIFKAPKPDAPVIAPAITPRADTTTELPTKKDIVDPDEAADVEYGSSKKKSGPMAGKRGTDALKIPLNTGTGTGGGGGPNQP